MRKRAIISGATRGVGLAVCKNLAQSNYDLAVAARTKNEIDSLEKDLLDAFPGIEIIAQNRDFSNKEEVIEFTDSILEKWGSVDVIVNNVGSYSQDYISENPKGQLEKSLSVNLLSAYYLTQPFLASMKENKKGHIFTICSVLSKEVRADAASYTIAKHALLGFNKVLCEEMSDHQVKVTAIIPGSINTSSWDDINAPKKEFVQPEDIANAISNALELSSGANLEELVIKPLNRNY